MRTTDHRRTWRVVRGGAVALLLVLAGCATQRPAEPGASPPVPPPQLLATGELELPGACEPRAGAVYRVSFVVQGDGRVAQVEPGPGAGCVQDALRSWVGTFQYRAPGVPVASVLHWMGVTAARLR